MGDLVDDLGKKIKDQIRIRPYKSDHKSGDNVDVPAYPAKWNAEFQEGSDKEREAIPGFHMIGNSPVQMKGEVAEEDAASYSSAQLKNNQSAGDSSSDLEAEDAAPSHPSERVDVESEPLDEEDAQGGETKNEYGFNLVYGLGDYVEDKSSPAEPRIGRVYGIMLRGDNANNSNKFMQKKEENYYVRWLIKYKKEGEDWYKLKNEKTRNKPLTDDCFSKITDGLDTIKSSIRTTHGNKLYPEGGEETPDVCRHKFNFGDYVEDKSQKRIGRVYRIFVRGDNANNSNKFMTKKKEKYYVRWLIKQQKSGEWKKLSHEKNRSVDLKEERYTKITDPVELGDYLETIADTHNKKLYKSEITAQYVDRRRLLPLTGYPRREFRRTLPLTGYHRRQF